MTTPRRDWLQLMATFSAGAVADALIPRRALSWQQQPDKTAAFRAQIAVAPIQTRQLRDNLTLLSGPGGNIVVVHGAPPEGLTMVDTFVAPAWPKLEESLKALGAPVQVVINTHWHLDHTDNNGPLHAAGATVVAHENTKRRMRESRHLPMLELDLPPSPAAALPQRVFKDGYTLEANGERIQLNHVAPAHTDSDVIVRFERGNVLQTGDVYFNGRYPFIDWSTGGRIDGMIAAANRVLDTADADTMIVPGHGALATKADLTKYRDMLVTAADRVRKFKASG